MFFFNLSETKITTLFEITVRPLLEYGVICNPFYQIDIEKIQKVQHICLSLSNEHLQMDSW